MNDTNLVMNKSVSYLVRTRNKNDINDYESCLGDNNGKIALDLPCLVKSKIEPILTHKVEIKQ